MMPIPESELILNSDRSVYHLKIRPEHLAETVILVGDPGRVPKISQYFDAVEFTMQNREIVTHTGRVGTKMLTVMSTGMGTDNLDIVINELDALVNIDLDKRVIKEKHTSLNLIRLGTSGALQAGIEPGTAVASQYGIGLDGLLYFYHDYFKVNEEDIAARFIMHAGWNDNLPGIYAVAASQNLLNNLAHGLVKGITLTAPGFYGPQGREVRLRLAHPELNSLIETFDYNNIKILNFEMETSALYGIGRLLGHQVLTICNIVANRVTKTYARDYQSDMDRLIRTVLERLAQA